MKVTKSTIYKLEIERTCTCKVAGDYEDVAFKKPRGTAIFTACATHKETPGVDVIEEMMREVLEKEAREAKAPEVILPRAAQAAAARAEEAQAATPAVPDPNANAPARTLRVAGSNGTAASSAGHRPASAPTPQPGRGTHRPEGKTGGSSPFRRADPNAGLSAGALSKVGGGKPSSSALSVDFDQQVPEDSRVTALIEDIGFEDDENEGDE